MIDWDKQWELFAENYYEGKAHINLSKFGASKTLLLLPGPGFGDLSHPTTYLMLDLMHTHIYRQSIIDIGTGSGILALSSLLLGASSAIGIDIDPEALLHARKNNKLNHLKATFRRSLPKKLPSQNIFLMNMISSEQQSVHPSQYNRYAKIWIVSGVLKEQKNRYLQLTETWNWKPIKEKTRKGWMGWVFTCKCKAALH